MDTKQRVNSMSLQMLMVVAVAAFFFLVLAT